LEDENKCIRAWRRILEFMGHHASSLKPSQGTFIMSLSHYKPCTIGIVLGPNMSHM